LSKSPEQSISSENNRSFQQNSTHQPEKQKILIETPPRPPYEYGEVPDPSPKRRKLDADKRLPQVVIQYQAQKEEAEVALSKFQDFLQEIFDAQDRLEPDTSNSYAPETTAYFEDADGSDDSTLRLASKVQSKLQNAIKKLTLSKNFVALPPDDVKRLQKICEGSILDTQTINLHLGEEPSEEDVGHWQASVFRAENGLTSACTLAWTILGSLDNKELCPEDIVQCMPVLLTNVFENCLMPILESRSGGRTSGLFKLASASKDLLTRLLHQGRKLLSLMADICLEMESAETAITRTEYLATQLIFVESSHTEKDSVLGVQVFETVRKTAMEALAKIFSRFTDQRQSILDEILSSLQKLSTTKQGARQFKLVDGKNIQLVSALVMQLVQTVANEPSEHHQKPKAAHAKQTKNLEAVADSEDEDSSVVSHVVNDEETSSITKRLSQKANKLYQRAVESANYIINYFVQRAKVSTKTGDQPHRNLLDLFTEDLLSVLGSPDWPAAELLLWILARHMLAILNDDKSAATPKNMALELLGWMGSAISNLLLSIQSLCGTFDRQDSSVSQYLMELAEDQLQGSLRLDDIVTETGPFRIALEYLRDRHNDQNNWQLKTARGYYLAMWAKIFSSTIDNEEGQQFKESEAFCKALLKAFNDSTYPGDKNAFDDITPHQGRLAYLLTVMHMGFCKAFDVIVKVLLQSLTSDQAKMRSRSLKSVIAMLEADPKLLDRDAGVMNVIFRCASDPSPMVRDNALSLIAKCMSLRPGLEESATQVILERAGSDVATGVRKRCLTILKDIYLHNTKSAVKASIARAFLLRLNDPEETVALLAHQSLFDIWIALFIAPAGVAVDTAKAKVALNEQVSLVVKTINTTESINLSDLLSRLEQFYRNMFKDGIKTNALVSIICSSIVDILFDSILNSSERTSKQEQRAFLSYLEALAKADASLIKPEQLQALQPYIQNLSTDDDLFFFRSVVVIYRCVLPHLSDKALLKAIQNDLMRAVSRLGRAELNEAVSCLWTIDRVLHNTERLVKLTVSLLKNIYSTKIPYSDGPEDSEATSRDASRRLRSYLRITGCVGKYCDLESFANSFKEIFPAWKGTSVTSLMVDLICPLTTPERPSLIRIEALHSLASICQSWPGQFNKELVRKSFSEVLEKGSSDLQHIVVISFLEFFRSREAATESNTAAKSGGRDDDTGRLDSSLKASDHDGAAALIAQHFLSFILQIAISGNEQNDMPAIEVIASINRQGLVHPKECAGALVALETSPRPLLAKVACDCHRLLHQQHETTFEREYMRAIREAYEYQRDVLHDSTGAKARPFVPKLSSLYEIIKTSNLKYLRKFFRNLVMKVSVDISDLSATQDATDQVLFSRFIVQNLAYLDYGKLDELVHVISFVESHVGKAGAEIAQAIEAQGIGRIEIPPGEGQNFGETRAETEALPSRVVESAPLKRLVIPAMTLTMLWETRVHLRRQYGIIGAVQENDGKSKDAKEMAKAPTKVHGITGERFWENISDVMNSLSSNEAMVKRCHDFAQLMAMDDEVKVAAEVGELRDSYSASVDPEVSLQPVVNGSKGSRGKRKSSVSVSGTPKKKKRGRPSLNGRRRSSAKLDSDDDWD
jgi:cohesin loading factor subunit SCC2